jgi:antitoxin (DNA-binding transcriptional repressor) of toxin-antitoxin stability system
MAVMYWIQEAKRILPQLIKNAAAGQTVIICRGKVPMAQLLAIKRPQHRKPGTLKGILTAKPDAFDPLTAKELKTLGLK